MYFRGADSRYETAKSEGLWIREIPLIWHLLLHDLGTCANSPCRVTKCHKFDWHYNTWCVWLWEDLKLETSWIHHQSPRKHQLGEEHYQVAESSHAKFVMAGSSLLADNPFVFGFIFGFCTCNRSKDAWRNVHSNSRAHMAQQLKVQLAHLNCFRSFWSSWSFWLPTKPLSSIHIRHVRHAHVSLQQVGSLGLNLTLQQLGMRGKYIRGEVDCGGRLWRHNLSLSFKMVSKVFQAQQARRTTQLGEDVQNKKLAPLLSGAADLWCPPITARIFGGEAP